MEGDETMSLVNVIKTGGYVFMIHELTKQVKELGALRTKERQRSRTRNMIIGVGIGSAVGAAAGILFAPKSGRETRHSIAHRTGETVKHLKENVAATKDRIVESAADKKKESSE